LKGVHRRRPRRKKKRRSQGPTQSRVRPQRLVPVRGRGFHRGLETKKKQIARHPIGAAEERAHRKNKAGGSWTRVRRKLPCHSRNARIEATDEKLSSKWAPLITARIDAAEANITQGNAAHSQFAKR